MSNCDLIIDKIYSLNHQAKNLLLGFKTRIIERSADITTKFLDSHRKIDLALLFLLKLSEPADLRFHMGAFISQPRTSLCQLIKLDYAGLIGVNQSLDLTFQHRETTF